MLVELQGEETIDAHTFANACVRMKGAATSIDLQTVMFTTHLMNKDRGGACWLEIVKDEHVCGEKAAFCKYMLQSLSWMNSIW